MILRFLQKKLVVEARFTRRLTSWTALSFFILTPVSVAGPKRIVTLTPSLAEWVAEIFGQSRGSELLVATAEYSEYPAWVKKVESIGPYPKINIEAVAKKKPDLVLALAESNAEEQLQQLERLGLKVQRLPREDFATMPNWIKKLGQVLDEAKAANSLAERWKSQVQEISGVGQNLKKHRIFIEVQADPLVSVGALSFLTAAFRLIGQENVFANLNQAYPKVSREAVVRINPTAIYLMDLGAQKDQLVRSTERWKKFDQIAAVQAGQIHLLEGDDYGRCTFRLLQALMKQARREQQ